MEPNRITEEFNVDYPIKWDAEKKKWTTESKKVVIKLMDYGEKTALTDKYMKMEVIGKRVIPKIVYGDMIEQTLLAAIVEAPFPLTIEGIRRIPNSKIGDEIYAKISALNGISEEDEKNSDGDSSTAPPILS